MTRRVLVARLDSDGDVLLAGPAIRAVAAAAEVVLLCGPQGRAAAELLPGPQRVEEFAAPWILADPPPVDRAEIDALVDRLQALNLDEAVLLTSFHQSPLPSALLLRMAGVRRIAAISEDYPGALLDVRHRCPVDLPEPERALSLAAAAGYCLPPGDDGRLRLRTGLPAVDGLTGDGRYVVVHPGASVPARAIPAGRAAQAVTALARTGFRVLVTGSPAEAGLTATVADVRGEDLGGRTSLAELAGVLAGADAVVVGNTGPAHLAAAVGTPVVSLYAPTVPFRRWAPYRVPCVRLGDPEAPCQDSRARVCELPGHPCLDAVSAAEIVAAVRELTRSAA